MSLLWPTASLMEAEVTMIMPMAISASQAKSSQMSGNSSPCQREMCCFWLWWKALMWVAAFSLRVRVGSIRWACLPGSFSGMCW